MKRQFIGIEYEANNGIDKKLKDFMLLYNHLKGVGFIYNENITQWIKGSYSAGGGNAIMRQKRSDGLQSEENKVTDNFVLGIPTVSGNTELTDEYIITFAGNKYSFTVQEIVDMAITNIENTILTNNVQYIYWSTDNKKNLAYSIFKPYQEFKDYVNKRMDQIVEKVEGEKILQSQLPIPHIVESNTLVCGKNIDNIPTIIKKYIESHNKQPIQQKLDL